MRIKTVIFDFDGTIADSLGNFIEVINKLSSEYGYKRVLERDKKVWMDKTSREVVRDLGISGRKLPFFVRDFKKEFNKKADGLRSFIGVKQLLLKLKKKGFVLGLVSSNSKKNIKHFLEKNDMRLFDFVYSDVGVFSKRGLLSRVISSHRLRKDEVIYVGDETRDINSARKSGIRIMSVTWGYNSEKALRKLDPDFLAKKPSDVLDMLISL